jgi:hypothetical protein
LREGEEISSEEDISSKLRLKLCPELPSELSLELLRFSWVKVPCDVDLTINVPVILYIGV